MKERMKVIIASTLAVLACRASLQAAPVIHEPFAQTTGALNGKLASTTGLTGNWTASSTFVVSSGSPTWGTLPVSGNQVTYSGTAANSAASVGFTTSTLSTPGLLADGATLWFSMLVRTPDTTGTNPDTGFAIGTDVLGSGNGLPMSNSGSGLGWTITGGNLRATYWLSGAKIASSGVAVANSTSYLIVGKITWGTGGGADKIDLFLPNISLDLGTVRQTISVAITQSAFDTIAFGMKSNTGFGFDEIRFGATYLDVVGMSGTAAYWDINDTATGAGGASPAGTWDTAASNNWNAVAAGTGSTAVWTPGQAAVFAAGTDATGSYSVTVDGTPSISALTFEEGTVTISGGTALDLVATGGALEVRPATASATVGTPLTQTTTGGTLYKEGAGTLTLSGNNTYDCPTIVNAGTLILSGDNSGASGTMTLNAGITRFDSTLAIPGSGRSVTLGSAAVAMFGPLSNADIATGLSRIVTNTTGTVAADNNAGATFNFSADSLPTVYLGAVGNVSFTGTITPNANAYRLGGGGGTLTISGANKLNNTGATKTLTVNGPGTVVLANNNNYNGNTAINSGATLVAGSATSLGAGAIGGGNDFKGTLVIATSSTFGSGQILLSTGCKIMSDGTTARAVSSVTMPNSGNTAIFGDSVNDGKLTFNAAAGQKLSSGATTYQCDSEVEFATGFQSSAQGFSKTGAGSLIISGYNANYNGATTVSAGALRIGHSSGLGGTGSGTTVSSGAALELYNNITVGAEALSLNGTGISAAGALRNLSGTNTYRGMITLAASARINADSGSKLILDVASGSAITNAFTLTLGGSGDITVADPIGPGTGSLAKAGIGSLVLSAVNTYSGATTITNGPLTGVVGGSCDNSDVRLNADGTLGISVTDNTKQWSCKSLTVGSATGTKLKFAFDMAPSASLAPLKVLNNLTFTGVPEVEVSPNNIALGVTVPLLVVGGTPPAATPLPTLIGIDGALSWGGVDNKTLNLTTFASGTVFFVR